MLKRLSLWYNFTDMNTEVKTISVKPPNVIKALREGFDAIANHIGIILFPLGLDLYLWLGPHWRISYLIDQMLQAMAQITGSGQSDLLRMGTEFWKTAEEHINLFSLLRTYPVGIFSLMAGIQPIETPFGKPLELQAQSALVVIFAWVILTLVGIVGGTLYFNIVAKVALEGHLDWKEMGPHWLSRILQVIFLSLFWIAIAAMILIPSSCLVSVFATSNITISQIVLLIIIGLIVWLFFPLLLSPHGIFASQVNMWNSVKNSIKVTRFTFPTTILLFLLAIAISQGLDLIWRLPKETSWLMVIGIAGHGFITSSLLATTFVYYRDANQWVEEMLQQIKITTVL